MTYVYGVERTRMFLMKAYLLPVFFVRPRSRGRTFPGCDQLLERSRRALRRGKLDLAEAFVMEGGDAIWANAACLNVLGLIAEARGKWSKARRLWGRSIR